MHHTRILLMDNDDDFRASTQDYLEEHGFKEIISVPNIEEATKQLEQHLVHVAILDIRMKKDDDEADKSGLDLSKTIDPLVSRIILTAHPLQEWAAGSSPVRVELDCAGGRTMGYFVWKKDKNYQRLLLKAIKSTLESEFEIIPRKRFAILTSGGDAPGMNAAIRAVVRIAMANNVEVVGVYDGYRGLVHDWTLKLRWNDVSDIAQRGGTILRTSRYERLKDPDKSGEAIEAIEQVIKRKHISGLIVIGGDGSMKGARKIATELSNRGQDLRFVVLPGTIDNDIWGTDMSLGAASAANAMIHEFRNMLRPAQALRRIFIGEVMGRFCGYLALETALGVGADAILLPEQVVETLSPHPSEDTEAWVERIDPIDTQEQFDKKLDEVAEILQCGLNAGKRYGFVVLAEGIRLLTDGELDCKYVRRRLEARIRKWLRHSNVEVVDAIPSHLGGKVIDWEKEPPPDVREQVLGYPVRGVPPCRFDVWLGTTLGTEAVLRLLKGKSGVMLGWKEEEEGGINRTPEGVVETEIQAVVDGSNRPPKEIWGARPKWRRMLEMHEVLACPPDLGLRTRLEERGTRFIPQE